MKNLIDYRLTLGRHTFSFILAKELWYITGVKAGVSTEFFAITRSVLPAHNNQAVYSLKILHLCLRYMRLNDVNLKLQNQVRLK